MAGISERLRAAGLPEDFVEAWVIRHEEGLRDGAEQYANDGVFFEDWLGERIETARKDYEMVKPWHVRQVERAEIRPQRRYKRKRKANNSDSWERQESLAKYLTARMRPAGSVLVGGRLLSPEEASAFLDSPLAASYPTGFIAHCGLDAMLNPSVVGEGEDKRGPYRTLQTRGEWGTGVLKIRPLGWTVEGPVFPGSRFEGLDFAGLRPAAKARVGFVVHPHNPDERIVVSANSVLARLNKATSRISGEPISPEKSLWFILTGEFIPEPPVRIRSERSHTPGWYRRAKITLEVEGWMNAEEVADHYRHAQRQVFGKIPRSLDAKSRALLDFVNQNKGMTWQKRYEKWNKEHPAWRFKQVGHLHQQLKRALRKLANGD